MQNDAILYFSFTNIAVPTEYDVYRHIRGTLLLPPTSFPGSSGNEVGSLWLLPILKESLGTRSNFLNPSVGSMVAAGELYILVAATHGLYPITELQQDTDRNNPAINISSVCQINHHSEVQPVLKTIFLPSVGIIIAGHWYRPLGIDHLHHDVIMQVVYCKLNDNVHDCDMRNDNVSPNSKRRLTTL
jgi:hypothetical protein